jgi:hypothetical protein
LRWGVIARDGDRCDRLGSGDPTRRILGKATVSGPATPDGPPPTVRRPVGTAPVAGEPASTERGVWSLIAAALGIAAIAVFRSWVRRGRATEPRRPY